MATDRNMVVTEPSRVGYGPTPKQDDGTRYGTTLEEAARSIIYQGDHYARHGDWDYAADHPSIDNGQEFSGWVSDLLESALLDEKLEPYSYEEEYEKAHYEAP